MVFCSQLDALITASEELSIRVWGPDWDLRMAFVGHNGVVSSLFFCPAISMLLSASQDCTIQCWSLTDGDVVECVHVEQETPPLCIRGNKKGDAFFSFSRQGVDVWTVRSLYTLHCKLKGAPLRQILTSPFPAPYPKRVLCLSGDSDITLVAAETGAVLTSFRAQQRVLCADYCLQREILLALTHTGTVLQANTLTNPVTVMQEWQGRGQGVWRRKDHVTEEDAQTLPPPGPAQCLVLYSCVSETQEAVEEWRSLQQRRGSSHRKTADLDDDENKFLVVLGQSGGCVSVLRLDNGKVLQRTAAHNGQRVTSMQAHPESGYLLTAGEDRTVVVWKVSPYLQESLVQQVSVLCDQPQVHLAALGLQLALTCQDPESGSYSLRTVNLLDQNQGFHQQREGHADTLTDGTVCVWNEENQLIRGEVFLGIRGDLYRMDCTHFLPHEYQQMLLYTYCAEPVPDTPECVSSVIVSMDLSALLRGSVKCRKPKPLTTKETSREAFENYMRILYGLPLNIKVDLEDKLDPVEPEIASFDPDPYQKEPVTLPVLKKVVHREAIVEIVVKKKKKKRKEKDPETTPPPKPLKQFKPVPRVKKPIKVKKYKEFSLQLLDHVTSCSSASRLKILSALQALRSQNLLLNSDQIYQGLLHLLHTSIKPPLVLEAVLSILTSLSVNEPEMWLSPEMEGWKSDPSNTWSGFHDRAESWLQEWISKYKEHARTSGRFNPSTVSLVDVLNYFCSVQREEFRKNRCVAPAGHENTVLMPLNDCGSHPIQRLGETHSMARTWKTPGFILPALRHRPFLSRFPRFISFPLPRVTLLPFLLSSEETWLQATYRRYFILQESYVEYYR
ncbi:WD repeat-containing protein 97 [Dissostichus eleginoides]|uniref:WD repeat-containing protein 97 n=1 Tax=Dissostichus eleginoides TaxID=100907 RepID=A0AAD9BKD8_DISEL|nr:WD repeat-containing protein 97 [Dissostichus eleginoides]